MNLDHPGAALSLLCLGLVLIFLVLDWSAEYLWFETLGYVGVFLIIRLLKVGIFLGTLLPLFLYLWANLRVLSTATNSGTAAKSVLSLIALAMALIFALVVASQWDTFLRFFWSQGYGETDPVLRAYRAALPTLFRPLEEMSEELRRHLRYPQDLFAIQVAAYNSYHMTLPQVFYNREDLWDVPKEKYGGEQITMKPYYVLIKLPEEQRLGFLLMTPLTPNNRDNMIAWMAARSDFPGYGELLVYKLPKERLILGPLQVEATIDQDPRISEKLSLWDQRGSRVVRGSLLVIPVEQSFIYVEPVYLIAEGTDIPQLKRVIVSDGEQVPMEPTLEEALTKVFGGDLPAESLTEAAPCHRNEAKESMMKAEQALKEGDWEAFGRVMQELKETVGE